MNNPRYKIGDAVIFHDWLGVIRSIGQEYNSYTEATIYFYMIDWITIGDKKQNVYPEDYPFHERDIDKWHGKYRDRILKKDRVQEIV